MLMEANFDLEMAEQIQLMEFCALNKHCTHLLSYPEPLLKVISIKNQQDLSLMKQSNTREEECWVLPYFSLGHAPAELGHNHYLISAH